jgi:K319-like protein/OmpA family protein
MLFRSIKILALWLVVAGLVLGQGLNTAASKDDWEEINFEFDSDVLVDGFPSLLRLGELLNTNSDYRVKLVGHADYKGSPAYNAPLSERRANAVKEFLEKYGARAGQISVSGQGESSPKVSAQTDEARFMNRRVEMTITDGSGRVIGAGGVGDAIGALEKLAKAQEECCSAILKKLDKLDDILAALNQLKNENKDLRGEIDALKAGQSGLKQEVAAVPKQAAPTKQEIAEVAQKAAEDVTKDKFFEHFSVMGLNVGTDFDGKVTFSGKGRFFRPMSQNIALQVEGEYMAWSGRKEGQFDFGLVGRRNAIQVGVFGSLKHVSLSEYANSGMLGQASATVDYIFGRGKVGLFGAKGFREKDLIQTTRISRNVIENVWLQTVDQIGVSTAVGLWDNAWVEGNLGFLYGRQVDSRVGGTVRLIVPFRDHWAFTAEGGANETMLSRDTYGRWAVGVRFGNFLSPKRYSEVAHPVPVDIPRVRWEVMTEKVRTGNDAPDADAGPDLIGVQAGMVTLDGSGSTDPDGDTMTFLWSQLSGPSVMINGADQAKATFLADDGQVYSFRLTVTDELGAAGSDTVSVTSKDTPTVEIMNFRATPSRINRGDSSTLSWQVKNATEVSIDPNVGIVDANSGSFKVTPSETTVYTMTAKNDEGDEVRLTALVTVDTPKPTILRCDVTPQNIFRGDSAELNWQVDNANSVNLTGFGDVPHTGSQTVSPTDTTTYTLAATNANGTVSCPLTVQVTPGEVPQIIRYTASPMEILAGTSASLLWQVENADEVSINNGVGAVSDTSGQVSVSPTQTTAYTITATNRYGTVNAHVTINVVQPAEVTSFTVTDQTPTEPSGVEVFLNWTTQHATTVTIDGGLGPRPANGSVPLRVTTTTTFTIVASNKFSEDTRQVTVTVP